MLFELYEAACRYFFAAILMLGHFSLLVLSMPLVSSIADSYARD